ncbi:spermine/spermidine N-acetyltransferase [Trichococcus patagoniensis]|uniref:Spermine/spermidine N-acetyltransferase n=1 Tax=Trichococcus patagoniensis TaxID=382641 RepID=A0A2T5IJ05_9LACT|nr:N-acetyltransferase [Trichococcus patagoniensis]PTQ83815.1 spermine/spermidine N-acetyltransferase [Trichococcus patagoniensis]
MTLEIRKCTHDDIPLLQTIGIETFSDTFADQNTPEDLQAYLDKAYAFPQMEKELVTDGSTFFFVYADEHLAGYMKVNTDEALTEDNGTDSLEIERIYVRPGFKRKGIGRYLLEHAIGLAQQAGKRNIWLGVWEHNAPARAFYKTMGFERTGEHAFYMGADKQIDHIMTKIL